MGRKKPGTRKPRTEAAYFRTTPNTTRLELSIDPETWRVTAGMECETAFTAVTYEREAAGKGDKTVNKLFSPTGEPAVDSHNALNQFSVCVAIDTNTKSVDGRRRSVTAVVIADDVAWGVPYCIEVADSAVGKEERIGWQLALAQLVKDGFLRSDTVTAIIVDAHLNDLEAINRREQAFVEDIILPGSWVMNYASADVGTEFQANRLMRSADSTARMVIDHLAAIGASLPAGPIDGAIFGQSRVIRSRNSFTSWAELHQQQRRKA